MVSPMHEHGKRQISEADLEANASSPDVIEGHFDHLFPEFCTEVHSEPSMSTTPATIAAEYLRVFQSDRTWVLLPSGSRWRVKAVGGIPSFQRRSDVVRKLEQLVNRVVWSGETFVWMAGEQDETLSGKTRAALDQYLDEAHVSQLRIESLEVVEASHRQDRSKTPSPKVGVVVSEWFQPARKRFRPADWLAAQQQASIALSNAGDWGRAPVARLLRGLRRSRSWQWLAGWGALIAIAATLLTTIGLTPIDFTIDARGQVQPAQRRHVFATNSGIVRSLQVSSGQKVEQGDLLLELDSPELELEIRRVEGELGTTEKRIQSIEASRLDFGLNTPDSVNQMNSLAGELKELKQKRENLIHEIDLLSQRLGDLKIVSPIRGQVVTWDVERLLSHRPVSRGQRLLTVSDSDGPWEIELRVADEDTSDLYTAMQQDRSVPIDFIVITLPDRIYSTTLRSVSDTVEIRSPGESPTILCQADVPDHLVDAAVEGMSIRGRIHCGRRPAVTVVFDKFWRVIREHLLFRWGW